MKGLEIEDKGYDRKQQIGKREDVVLQVGRGLFVEGLINLWGG